MASSKAETRAETRDSKKARCSKLGMLEDNEKGCAEALGVADGELEA